jgi:hypothetical protein
VTPVTQGKGEGSGPPMMMPGSSQSSINACEVDGASSAPPMAAALAMRRKVVFMGKSLCFG